MNAPTFMDELARQATPESIAAGARMLYERQKKLIVEDRVLSTQQRNALLEALDREARRER